MDVKTRKTGAENTSIAEKLQRKVWIAMISHILREIAHKRNLVIGIY